MRHAREEYLFQSVYLFLRAGTAAGEKTESLM